MGPTDGETWAAHELEGVDLSDSRLDRRAVKILQALADNPQASIPEAHRNWAETVAAYRFLDNDRVTHESMLKPHKLATLERVKAHRLVLAIQDTSSLNYSGLKATSGLGEIGDGKAKGLVVHTTYAVSSDGLPLGTLDQCIWARKPSQHKTPQARAKTAVGKKESVKWSETIGRVSALTRGLEDTDIVHVMDREADIYELFSEAQDLSEHFIIRAHHNRKINKTSRGSSDGSLMLTSLAKSPSLGTVLLDVKTRTDAETMRQAEVTIRSLKFKLTAPRAKSDKVHKFKNKDMELTVMRISEVNCADESIEPIDWILLTNVDIKSVEDVLLCVQYYCYRWHIEVFHRIMKTGCRVEKCRLSSAEAIEVYVALLSIVAWRLHWLTLLARLAPQACADLAFTNKEQAVLHQIVAKKKPPKHVTLNDTVILLARLGGFLNRKGDGPPGSEVLWRGLIKLRDFLHNLAILEATSGLTYV